MKITLFDNPIFVWHPSFEEPQPISAYALYF